MKRRRYRDISLPRPLPFLVKFIFLQMNEQEIGFDELSLKSGVHHAFTNWRIRSSPLLANYEAVLNALGFELVIRRKSDGKIIEEKDQKASSSPLSESSILSKDIQT